MLKRVFLPLNSSEKIPFFNRFVEALAISEILGANTQILLGFFSMFFMKFLPVPFKQNLSIPYDNFFCRIIVVSKTGAGGSALSTFSGGIIQCSSIALYSYLSLSYLSTFIWNRLLILITVTHREALFIFDI